MSRIAVAVLVALLTLAAASPAGAASVATGIVQVDASHDHTLARTTDGRVLAWGANERGQLGDGTTVDRSRPVAVTGLPPNVVDVAAGKDHSLAVTATGAVYAWGTNDDGQLGDGSFDERHVPTQVTTTFLPGATRALGPALPPIRDVEAHGASYAIAQSGDVYSWGLNTDGQLGIGFNGATTASAEYRERPVRMSVVSGAAEVAAGATHALVRTEAGVVYGMGDGWLGQIGTGSWGADVRTTDPVALGFPGLGGATIAQVQAGESTSYAVTSGGRVYAWGSGAHGALGLGAAFDVQASPTLVPTTSAEHVVEVVAGAQFAFARLTGGAVRGWGRSASGQLGDGVTDARLGGVALPALAGSAQLAAGRAHALALDAAGNLRGWGSVEEGQVGNGKIRFVPTPEPVPGATGVAEVVAGAGYSLARTAGGTLLAWGANAAGVLGNDMTASRAAARPVAGLSGIVDVATGQARTGDPAGAGIHHVLAVDGAGEVWAWGRNGLGQVGDGTTTDRRRPVWVEVPGKVVAVAAGGAHSLALTDAGDVYAWGDDTDLQAAGTGAPVHAPRKVAGLPPVAEVGAGIDNSVARTAAGAVYVWGSNARGQLGGSSSVTASVPAALTAPAGLAPAQSVAAGGDHVLVAGAGQSVWGWGLNHHLQVGAGPVGTTLYAPVRVTDLDGRGVTRLSSGPGHSLGITATGDVLAWGSNEQRQIGHGVFGWERATPVALAVDATGVSAGARHSLALGADGQVYAWGDADGGALGFAVPAFVPTPDSEGVAPADPAEPDLPPLPPPGKGGGDDGGGPPPGGDGTPPGGPGAPPSPTPPAAPRGPVTTPPAADRAAPRLTLAQPACARRLSAAKCRAFRRTAAAYRTLRGTASDPSGIARIEVAVAGKVGSRWYAVAGGKLVRRASRAAALRSVGRASVRGTAWTAGLPTLRPGTWIVRVRAVDRAGNASAWVQRTVRIARR